MTTCNGCGLVGIAHRSVAGDVTFRVFELDYGEVGAMPVSVLECRMLPKWAPSLRSGWED